MTLCVAVSHQQMIAPDTGECEALRARHERAVALPVRARHARRPRSPRQRWSRLAALRRLLQPYSKRMLGGSSLINAGGGERPQVPQDNFYRYFLIFIVVWARSPPATTSRRNACCRHRCRSANAILCGRIVCLHLRCKRRLYLLPKSLLLLQWQVRPRAAPDGPRCLAPERRRPLPRRFYYFLGLVFQCPHPQR